MTSRTFGKEGIKMVHAAGFEPATPAVWRQCSTTELSVLANQSRLKGVKSKSRHPSLQGFLPYEKCQLSVQLSNYLVIRFVCEIGEGWATGLWLCPGLSIFITTKVPKHIPTKTTSTIITALRAETSWLESTGSGPFWGVGFISVSSPFLAMVWRSHGPLATKR